MKTSEISFTLDQDVPKGEKARLFRAVVTATHVATGISVKGARPVLRFSKQHWKERANLARKLEQAVAKGKP